MDMTSGRDYFYDCHGNSQWEIPTTTAGSDVSPRQEVTDEIEDAAQLEESINSMPEELQAARRSLMPVVSAWPFTCSAEADDPSGYRRYKVSVIRGMLQRVCDRDYDIREKVTSGAESSADEQQIIATGHEWRSWNEWNDDTIPTQHDL